MNKFALKDLLGMDSSNAPLLSSGNPWSSGGSTPASQVHDGWMRQSGILQGDPQGSAPPSKFQASLQEMISNSSEEEEEEGKEKPKGGTASDPLSAQIMAVTSAVGLAADLIDRYGSKGRARRKLQDSLLAQQAHAINAKHQYKYGSRGAIGSDVITKLT